MKQQWKTFIKEMNMHGDAIKAYQKAYPKCKRESARVKSYNLLQNVTIAAEIKKHSDKIEAIATQKAAEELKNEIKVEVLTAERKKEILRLIAEGKEVQKEYKPEMNEEGKMVPVLVGFKAPTIIDRIKAIEVHNKMTGDESPAKFDHTIKDSPLTQSAIDKLREEIRQMNGMV